MPLHITMNDVAAKGADYLLSRQTLTEERKAQILPATKYNLLVKLFNVSSLILVAGTVSAIFLAMSSAFVFLVLGLFLRITTEKETEKYTLPYQAPQQETPEAEGMGARLWGRLRDAFQTNLLRHALHQTTEVEKVQNIFHNVGLPVQEGFVPNEILIFDLVGWKNTIDIPEVVIQRQDNAEQVQQPVVPPPAPLPARNGNAGAQGGIFSNLVGRLTGAAQQQQPPAPGT